GGFDDVPHIVSRTQDERPIHEGLHVTIGHDLVAEIGKQEFATRLDEFHGSLQQADADGTRQVIVKPRGVDEIERAKSVGAAKNAAYRALECLYCRAGKVVIHSGYADGV